MSDQDKTEDERSEDCRNDLLAAMIEIFAFPSVPSVLEVVPPPKQFLTQDAAFFPVGRSTFNRTALLADLSAPQLISNQVKPSVTLATNVVVDDGMAA